MEEDHEEERAPPRQRATNRSSKPTGPSPPASRVDAPDGLLPVSVGPAENGGGYLVVPTRSELELILANAADGDSLAELERAAASLLEVLRRQDHLKSEFLKLGEWSLRVKRKLGAILLQTDSRGGDQSKCHDDSLPHGSINSSAAKRLRKIGNVDEDDFIRYLARQHQRASLPTTAGCLRFSQGGGQLLGQLRRRGERRPSPNSPNLKWLRRSLMRLSDVLATSMFVLVKPRSSVACVWPATSSPRKTCKVMCSSVHALIQVFGSKDFVS